MLIQKQFHEFVEQLKKLYADGNATDAAGNDQSMFF